MKPKIFKSATAAFVILLTVSSAVFAQVSPVPPPAPVPLVAVPVVVSDVVVTPVQVSVSAKINKEVQLDMQDLRVKLADLKVKLKDLDTKENRAQIKAAIKNVTTCVQVQVNDVAPQIDLAFKDMGDEVDNDNANNRQDDFDQVKNYSKTYPADASELVIDNRYGNITVNTWDKNEFKVDVQIKVAAGNANDVQKLIDNVNISDARSGSQVAFRTDIGNESNGSWTSWFGGKHNSHKMEINYTVYMPAKNNLTIRNSYGSIVLPDLSGRVTVESGYGNFTAKSLTSDDNAIRVRYGNANIENLGTCAIEVSYGSLNLGSADRLSANIDYSAVKIGKIRVEGTINLRYGGGLQISDVDRNTKNLAINASYSNVKLGLSGDESADFAVVVKYGDFNYNDHNVVVTDKSPDDSKGFHATKSYKGYLGKSNSGKNIAVTSSYGNVSFD